MSIYDSLPSKVRNKVFVKKKKQDEYIQKYLTEILPGKRVAKGELELLKYKLQHLTNTKLPWTKLKSHRRRNFLSCRETKRLKLFNLPKDEYKFDDFLPIHRMWQDYIRDIIDFTRLGQEDETRNSENYTRLLKADFHGCMITVRKAKCPSMVGQSGIVLMETKHTFKIISKDNKVKCIPKENSIFAFKLDGFFFTLHGNNFRVKSSERVRKVPKSKATVDF